MLALGLCLLFLFFGKWVINKCGASYVSPWLWMSLKSCACHVKECKLPIRVFLNACKLWVCWGCIIAFYCFVLWPLLQSCGLHPTHPLMKVVFLFFSSFFTSAQWVGPTFIMQINLISAKNLGTQSHGGRALRRKDYWGEKDEKEIEPNALGIGLRFTMDQISID